MSRRTIILTLAVPLLALGVTGCSSATETGSEPTGSTPSPTSSDESGSEMYTLIAQPDGNLKAITFDSEAMPMGQAVFEGNLTSNEQGCFSLESATGMIPLAFSAMTFNEISDDGHLEIDGQLYPIGEAVSVVGGSQQVSEKSLDECGDPVEVLLVSTLKRP